MDRLTLGAPIVLVLAEGKTVGERNNARGRLFELFIARLLEKYGYDKPTPERINVTANGIELDIATRHRLTGQKAVAECKAYSANVAAAQLNQFYGKLNILRMAEPRLFGWFVTLPGLTPEGAEQLRLICSRDQDFAGMSASEVEAALRELGLITEPPGPAQLLSDIAIVVTEHGICSAGKQLDPVTRLPRAIRVWAAGPIVPEPVLALLAASDYAGGLDVRAISDSTARQVEGAVPAEPTVVEVSGSSSDFEYQLPASPKFFVGRTAILSDFEELIRMPLRGTVIVVNAQSGWGKSSLALQLREVVTKHDGYALVVDTRTASGSGYIWTVLRRAAINAQAAGLAELPADSAFGGLQSALGTLRNAGWAQPARPLLIFFDQFENVFRDNRLTREFRDLALSVAETSTPIILGFAWKTDLIGWTEDHPYQLRDDIRRVARLIRVEPLGPVEIDTLLRRLEKAIGRRLLPELRQRLREYSQGLPWLFKKLASHIWREIDAGVTQQALVTEALNVQRLFEADLAELGPHEQEAVRSIARLSPVPVSDAVALFPSTIVQSLLDRRLIVQVGERLDTYWDIFRDFLNTGRVPIQETYILRQTPASVSKLLKAVLDAGGELGVSEAAAALRTTEGVVFNWARDLRQMGVLVAAPGRIRVAEEIRSAEDREATVRERISAALRRHRAFSILTEEMEKHGGEVTTAGFAEALPQAFPAVQGQARTWFGHARAFLHWFTYARLIALIRDRARPAGTLTETPELLGSARLRTRVPGAFPQSPPGPALRVAEFLAGKRSDLQLERRAVQKAVQDLLALGAVQLDDRGAVRFTSPELLEPGPNASERLLTLLVNRIPGAGAAMSALRENPGSDSLTIGSFIREGYRASWAVSTTRHIGKYFRAWARLAGATTTRSAQEHRERTRQMSFPIA